MDNNEEIIICPNCKGLGYLWVTERVSLYDSESRKETCKSCKGGRVLIKKVNVTYEPVL